MEFGKRFISVVLSVLMILVCAGCDEVLPSAGIEENAVVSSSETVSSVRSTSYAVKTTTGTQKNNYADIKELSITVTDENKDILTTLKDYTELKKLSIRNKTGGDFDLSYCADLYSLEELEITSSSKYEFVNSDSLVNLNNLKSLIIENINCSDWSFLGKIKSLKHVTIVNSPYYFATSTSLEMHSFDYSQLNNCTGLESMVILDSELDFSFISNLAALKSIYLGTSEDGGMTAENFDSISNLQSLESCLMSLVSVPDNDFSPLGNCVNLTDLNINFTTIGNIDWLSRLTKLEYLKLSNVTIDGIQPLLELKNLKSLTMSETGLSKDDMEKLKSLYPHSETLY